MIVFGDAVSLTDRYGKHTRSGRVVGIDARDPQFVRVAWDEGGTSYVKRGALRKER